MENDTPTAMELGESNPKEQMNNNRDTSINIDEDLDAPVNNDEGTPLTTPVGKKKSYVWDHFHIYEDPKNPQNVCNYCGVSYARQKKRNGTSNMRAHLESQCKKYPLRFKRDKQSMLNFTINVEMMT